MDKTTYHIPIDSQMLQTQSSINIPLECMVKSKYLYTWTKREISINLEKEILEIEEQLSGRRKIYSLNDVFYTRLPKQKVIKLTVSKDRCYEIKDNSNLDQILREIDYYHAYKKLGMKISEQVVPKPGAITYNSSNSLIKHTESNSSNFSQHKTWQKEVEEYQREPSYIKLQDWQRDIKNGGLIFINNEKKHIMGQMISYTAKKVVKSGSMKNIDFPTYAMKPQSVLQTYCKCLGAAPLVLERVQKDPIERIKAFNVVILTMSLLYNDLDRSFNPLLGETFQGQIRGFPVYAEQISSKPSISYFLLMGNNYKLFGHLQLGVETGLNEVVGLLKGQITIKFDDGQIIKSIMPKGGMNGILVGETRFIPSGAVYSYDHYNKLVCSYELKKKDIFIGQVGRLKDSAWKKFENYVTNPGIDKTTFKHIPQKDYEYIVSRMEVVFTDSISYDGKLYFSYSDKKNLPFKVSRKINEKILPSDCSFRKDIKIRAQNNMQASQIQNDKLQKDQQRLNKLRRNYKN